MGVNNMVKLKKVSKLQREEANEHIIHVILMHVNNTYLLF